MWTKIKHCFLPTKLTFPHQKDDYSRQGGLLFFFKDFIYLFLERGERKDEEWGRNINVWLPLMWPPLGTWPTTQACALTGNWTSDPLVLSPRSIHWATPARAKDSILMTNYGFYFLTDDNYKIVLKQNYRLVWPLADDMSKLKPIK